MSSHCLNIHNTLNKISQPGSQQDRTVVVSVIGGLVTGLAWIRKGSIHKQAHLCEQVYLKCVTTFCLGSVKFNIFINTQVQE
jgi:hypothetical protein